MDPTEGTAPSALDELVADPSSRKRFLRMAGGGAVAAALSAVISACENDEETGNQIGGAGVGTESFGQGDAGIVNYALYLERIEVGFYEGAIRSGRLSGRALDLAKRFAEEEADHAESLTGTLKQLGAEESQPPKTSFVFENQDDIVTTAAQLEAVGAGAYLGQVRRIESKQILAAALSIHSVEARHAAALALLRGESIAPDGPFAAPSPSSDVLRQVQPFLTQ